MCDELVVNRGPWVGSDKTLFKHTFKGRVLKEVEIDMAPGAMV